MLGHMSQGELIVERDGPLAHLVLNRPQARNALTQAMWRAIPERVAEIAADVAVRVLVVRGVDASAFAAGADIGEFASVYSTPETARASSAAIEHALDAIAALPKPTIALVRGACVGGGCSLALACDLRFADASAKFGITPAKLGLAYSIADTRRLVAAVGVGRAKDLLFSGRIFGAAEAHAIGLVDRVEPSETIVAATLAYAQTIAEAAPGSHAATKRILARLAVGARDDDADANAAFLDLFTSADFAEGYKAFLEKRRPIF
jgi:enoyl-CoA hydratase/carnithine racemase